MKSWVRLKLSSLCETLNCLFCWKILKSFFSLTLSLSHSRACTHTLSLSFFLSYFEPLPTCQNFIPGCCITMNLQEHMDEEKFFFAKTSFSNFSHFGFKLQPQQQQQHLLFCLFWPDATKDGCLLLANGKNIDNVLVFVFVWAWVSDTLCHRVIVFALDLFSCRWPEQWWQLLGSCVDLRRRRLWVPILSICFCIKILYILSFISIFYRNFLFRCLKNRIWFKSLVDQHLNRIFFVKYLSISQDHFGVFFRSIHDQLAISWHQSSALIPDKK